MVQPGLGYLRLTGDTLRMLKMKARGPGFAAPFETKYLHSLGPHEFCAAERPLRRHLRAGPRVRGSGPAHAGQR